MDNSGRVSFQSEAKWDKIWKTTVLPAWDEMSEELVQVLLREMPDMAGKQVLECGCGSGRVSMRLVHHGASVTLLDNSTAALTLASRLSQQQGVSVDLVEGDIFSMPFLDCRFDLVWNAGVLEHFEEPQQVKILKEMRRVCKPGGLVVVIIPNAANPLYRLSKWWSEKTGRWVFGKEKPATSLVKVFKSSGFSEIEEYTTDFTDSIKMLGNIPGSETLQSLFHIWYESLDPWERAELPGRWLVSVGRVEAFNKQDIINPPLPGRNMSTGRARLDETRNGLPAVVCLSSIRWDELYQRPQQIMSRLAEFGHKVLFVEPAYLDVRLDSVRLPVEVLRNVLYNYASQSFRRKARGLYTFNPTRYVEWGDSQAPVRRDTIRASIQAACDLLDIRDPVWWVLTPLWHQTVEGLPVNLPVIYDCVDDHRYFAGVDPDTMGRLDVSVAKRANLVFVTARQLLREKIGIANALYLPNGVDLKVFQGTYMTEPEDLSSIPHPRLGFSGAVSTWVDVNLLYELAVRRPDWHIVVVGSIYTDVSRLLALPNFHYLGKKDYDSLPSYMKGFDVGLIPFKPVHPLVVSSNPIKLYEYLACGIPVVSTRWNEIAGFENVVSFAESVEGFETAIEEVLKNPPPAESLKAGIQAFDWGLIARIASYGVLLAKADANGDRALVGEILTRIEGLKERWAEESFTCWGKPPTSVGVDLPCGPLPYLDGLDMMKAYARVVGGDLDGVLHVLRTRGDGLPDGICRLANRLYIQGFSALAIELLEQALKDYPEDSDLIYNLAVLLTERGCDGDKSRAVEVLRCISQSDPGDDKARHLLDAMVEEKC